jgi:hypothetical protein
MTPVSYESFIDHSPGERNKVSRAMSYLASRHAPRRPAKRHIAAALPDRENAAALTVQHPGEI